jgi:hypothetical protein
MDAFMEKIVSRRKSPVERLKTTGIVFAALILMAVAVGVLPNLWSALSSISIFLVAGIGFGAWWLITSANVEYEYIVTNMDLDIDRITAQRKRKRMLSVKSKDFEVCAKRNGPNYAEFAKGSFKLHDYSADPKSPDCWFAVAQYKGERVMILFDPDDRMVQTFRRFNPSRVKYD